MKTEPSNHKSLFQDLKMANVYLRINFLISFLSIRHLVIQFI